MRQFPSLIYFRQIESALSSPRRRTNCPRERLMIHARSRVLHYGTSEIDLRVASFHSRFYPIASSPVSRKRVLTTTTTMTLASPRYRLCPVTCGLFALQDLWPTSVHRIAKVAVDDNRRYNRDNEMVGVRRHVRALTGKHPSNARSRRRDSMYILGKCQRDGLYAATSRLAYFCTVVYNPRSPVEAARQRWKQSERNVVSARDDGIRLLSRASYRARISCERYAGDLP